MGIWGKPLHLRDNCEGLQGDHKFLVLYIGMYIVVVDFRRVQAAVSLCDHNDKLAPQNLLLDRSHRVHGDKA